MSIAERAATELAQEQAEAQARRANSAESSDGTPRPTLYGNCIDGEGRCVWPTGESYEGGWLDNKHHGAGTFKWSTGAVYAGPWAHGVIDGAGGTMRFANGLTYVGGWASGKPQGQGRWVWDCGVVWAGLFVRGKPAPGDGGLWSFPLGWRLPSVQGAGPSTAERRTALPPARWRQQGELAAMAAEERAVCAVANAAWRKAAKAARAKLARERRSSSRVSVGSTNSSDSSSNGSAAGRRSPSFASSPLFAVGAAGGGGEGAVAPRKVSAATERRRTGTALARPRRSLAARGECICGAAKMNAKCICVKKGGQVDSSASAGGGTRRPNTIGGRRSTINKDAIGGGSGGAGSSSSSSSSSRNSSSSSTAAEGTTERGAIGGERSPVSPAQLSAPIAAQSLSKDGGAIISLSPGAMSRRLARSAVADADAGVLSMLQQHQQLQPPRVAERGNGGQVVLGSGPGAALQPLPNRGGGAAGAAAAKMVQQTQRQQQLQQQRPRAMTAVKLAKGSAGHSSTRSGGGAKVAAGHRKKMQKQQQQQQQQQHGGGGGGAAAAHGSPVRFKSPASIDSFALAAIGSPVQMLSRAGSRAGSRMGSRRGSALASLSPAKAAEKAAAARLTAEISDRLNAVAMHR